MSGSESGEALLRRADDAVLAVVKRGRPVFLPFSDENGCSLLCRRFSSHKCVKAVFYGGCPDAERKMAGLFPVAFLPENDEDAFLRRSRKNRGGGFCDAKSYSDCFGSDDAFSDYEYGNDSYFGSDDASDSFACDISPLNKSDNDYPAGSKSGDAKDRAYYRLFPLCWLELRGGTRLTHRDYLGSLMALGIKRELLGDILVIPANEGERSSVTTAYIAVFDENSISEYIISSCDRIGGSPVKLRVMNCGFSPSVTREFQEMTLSVQSLRLDGIVSEAANLSRSDSKAMISSGLVYLNGVQILSGDKQLRVGDVFSVRGHGKFRLAELAGETRSGRTRLKVKKYV